MIIKNEYKFINFFRALASFWVLITHCMIWGGWYGLPIPNPKLAVDLFMIISGYLMMLQTFLRKDIEPMTQYESWFKFWIRRFFRIAPAYYVSLIIAVIFSSYFLGGYHLLQDLNPQRWKDVFVYDPLRISYDIKNILLHISFLFGLDPQYSFSTFLPDWSLSLEMQFYFLFPFIFLLLSKWGRKKGILLIGLIALGMAWIINRFLFFYEPSFIALKLQYFLAGMILYFLLNTRLALGEKALLMIIGVFLLMVEHRFSSYGAIILFIVMLIVGWMERHKKLPSFLDETINNKVIRFMSDTSYSVYLFHGFFISLSGWIIFKIDFLQETSLFIHTLFMWFFVGVLTYLVAYVIFIHIEKRGILLGKKVANYIVPGILEGRKVNNVD